MFITAFLFAAVMVCAATAAVTNARDDCHKYVVVDTRGTDEPQRRSIAFRGMMDTTLNKVKGGVGYNVVYPASLAANSTAQGVEDVETYVHNGLKNCPGQKYALLGYSQGATVILTAVQNFTGTPAEDAIEALLFCGNPFQVANQPTTVDATGGDSTRDRNGDLLWSDRSIGLSEHWVDSGKVLNICNIGDNVCTSDGGGLGTNRTKYGDYPSIQEEGAKHLISRLQ